MYILVHISWTYQQEGVGGSEIWKLWVCIRKNSIFGMYFSVVLLPPKFSSPWGHWGEKHSGLEVHTWSLCCFLITLMYSKLKLQSWWGPWAHLPCIGAWEGYWGSYRCQVWGTWNDSSPHLKERLWMWLHVTAVELDKLAMPRFSWFKRWWDLEINVHL